MSPHPRDTNVPDCVLFAHDVAPSADGATLEEQSVAAQALEQADSLERLLRARGRTLDVLPGFLRRTPFYFDSMKRLMDSRRNRILVVILVPFPSKELSTRIETSVSRALTDLNIDRNDPVQALFSAPLHNRPGFIQANASRIRDSLKEFGSGIDPSVIDLLLVAPDEREDDLFRSSAHRIASRAGFPAHRTCGIGELPAKLELPAYEEKKRTIVAPIGSTLEDPASVSLLDAGIRAAASRSGVRCVRASACLSHPSFIASLSSLVEEALP